MGYFGAVRIGSQTRLHGTPRHEPTSPRAHERAGPVGAHRLAARIFLAPRGLASGCRGRRVLGSMPAGGKLLPAFAVAGSVLDGKSGLGLLSALEHEPPPSFADPTARQCEPKSHNTLPMYLGRQSKMHTSIRQSREGGPDHTSPVQGTARHNHNRCERPREGRHPQSHREAKLCCKADPVRYVALLSDALCQVLRATVCWRNKREQRQQFYSCRSDCRWLSVWRGKWCGCSGWPTGHAEKNPLSTSTNRTWRFHPQGCQAPSTRSLIPRGLRPPGQGHFWALCRSALGSTGEDHIPELRDHRRIASPERPAGGPLAFR